ncbi:MAG TPA: hypothetical protein DCQ13_07375 [Firmicutes bacterium]|nr:hypothetical protein [Bacillota bacterium]
MGGSSPDVATPHKKSSGKERLFTDATSWCADSPDASILLHACDCDPPWCPGASGDSLKCKARAVAGNTEDVRER